MGILLAAASIEVRPRQDTSLLPPPQRLDLFILAASIEVGPLLTRRFSSIWDQNSRREESNRFVSALSPPQPSSCSKGGSRFRGAGSSGIRHPRECLAGPRSYGRSLPQPLEPLRPGVQGLAQVAQPQTMDYIRALAQARNLEAIFLVPKLCFWIRKNA